METWVNIQFQIVIKQFPKTEISNNFDGRKNNELLF